PLKDPERKYSVAFHAIPNSWLLEAVQMTAGVALRWFRDEFCEAEKMEARRKGVSAYTLMDKEAEGSPIGANGVIFHPFLQGERSPFVKPSARGVFYGLGLWTKRADLIRAVLEAVAYAAKDNIDLFRRRKIEIREVRITGGGAASEIWCRIMSDVLNLKVTTPSVKECGALGAAIEASIVAGINKDPANAAERMVKVEKVFTPNQQNVEKYRRLFRLYKKLYELLWDYYDESWRTYSSL
ncbi:MAG: xylulokinase, partial [Thermoprotei archaeon]